MIKINPNTLLLLVDIGAIFLGLERNWSDAKTNLAEQKTVVHPCYDVKHLCYQ